MSMNAVPTVAGGGEPPYDKDMDRRLTVLETRFDTILPTLATRTDVEALRAEVQAGFEKFCGEFRGENEKLRGENEKLRGEFRSENEKLRDDMHKALHENTKFLIGVMISLFIGLLAVNIGMFNMLNSRLISIESTISAARQHALPGRLPLSPPPASSKAQ